jgi:membrane fusion protein (multidrug efflux system)
MPIELNNQKILQNNKLIRFLLLILLPILIVLIALGYFYSLGRYITTENAYIKAPIISVQSQVSGRIEKVFVRDNQKVTKGDRLFKIDTEKLELNLSEQKQNLINIIKEIENRKSKYNEAKEEVKLAREEIRFYASEIKRVKNIVDIEIKLAKEKVEFHKTELNRIKNLVEKGVGIKRKLDEARYLFNSAVNNLRYVDLNNDLEKIKYSYLSSKQKLKITEDKLKTILTTLNSNQNVKPSEHPLYLKHLSKLNQIKFDIQQANVFAKQDGIIAKLSLEEGEYIDIGKILFAIVDEKNSWLEANLKETELTNIKEGQSAFFVPDAYPDSTWKASVQSISPATGAEFSILPPQNSSGNWVKVVQRIPVKLIIGDLIENYAENKNKKDLRVGMSVSVTIDTGYENDVPIIIRPFASIFKSLRD